MIGQDCTAIQHSIGVGCNAGTCQVLSCSKGYKPSSDGKSCILKTGSVEGDNGQTVLGRGNKRDKNVKEAIRRRQAKTSSLKKRQ